MHTYRKLLKSTSPLWLAWLLPALLLMFSMQLHVHRLLDHQHLDDQKHETVAAHDHVTAAHKIHLGNLHDEQAGLNLVHDDPAVLAIDIPTKGLGKSFALMLLVLAFIAFSILLLSPRRPYLLLCRQQPPSAVIRWCCALSPLRRAPPF